MDIFKILVISISLLSSCNTFKKVKTDSAAKSEHLKESLAVSAQENKNSSITDNNKVVQPIEENSLEEQKKSNIKNLKFERRKLNKELKDTKDLDRKKDLQKRIASLTAKIQHIKRSIGRM